MLTNSLLELSFHCQPFHSLLYSLKLWSSASEIRWNSLSHFLSCWSRWPCLEPMTR